MNSGLPASAPLGGPGIPTVKVKLCRYYAKDKTCFYGEECQFLHEDPSMASLQQLHGGGSPVPLSMAGGGGTPAGYSLSGSTVTGHNGGTGSKKGESLGPTVAPLDGQLLTGESHMQQGRPLKGRGMGTLLWALWGSVKIEHGDSPRPLTQTMWFNPPLPAMRIQIIV